MPSAMHAAWWLMRPKKSKKEVIETGRATSAVEV